MNSLSSSYSHSTYPHTVSNEGKIHNRYDVKSSSQSFFAPLLQWLLLVSIALSVVLMMMFCTQPMSTQTVISDFWTGVDGVRVIVGI